MKRRGTCEGTSFFVYQSQNLTTTDSLYKKPTLVEHIKSTKVGFIIVSDLSESNI